MSYKAYLTAENLIKGSAKVPGHEQWVTLIFKSPTVIETPVQKQTSGDKQAQQPNFRPLATKTQLEVDLIHCFTALWSGKPLGTVTIDVVGAQGQSAELTEQTKITNGYVSFVAFSWRAEREKKEGNGGVTTVEYVGTAISASYIARGDNQQKTGQYDAKVSRLHQQSAAGS